MASKLKPPPSSLQCCPQEETEGRGPALGPHVEKALLVTLGHRAGLIVMTHQDDVGVIRSKRTPN